jgi:glycosyltransferase involved in cell wall biosynthesis
MYIFERFNALSNVAFLGTATVETKRILAEIATCILMPGRVGLIAIDSFQMGLPIISTHFDFHAPEFEYLINGKNSLISENDIQSYVEAIAEYLNDSSLQIQLKLGAQESERHYSLYNMQNGFVNKLLEIFSQKGDD